MRVLVVEDEIKVATLIRAGLEGQGFAVEHCPDGNAATDLAASGRFDAVVLDVMLPGRDGLSVLRRLRAGHHDVPVILLTARDDPTERVEGLNLGCAASAAADLRRRGRGGAVRVGERLLALEQLHDHASELRRMNGLGDVGVEARTNGLRGVLP